MVLLILDKLYQTSRLLFIWSKKNWSEEHRRSGASGKEPACQCRRQKRWGFNPWVRNKTHTHTCTHTHIHTHTLPLSLRSKENKEAVYLWQKQKNTLREECGHLCGWGIPCRVFWSPFCLIFSPRNEWFFWLGVKESLRRRLRCGLDCTRLYQHIYLLKSPFIHSKHKCCFPLNFPR